MRGYFITFEGTEGAGKSTNLHWAAEWLSAHAIDVVTTREPGGTVIAEQIRALLLNPDLPDMHPDTELMLMFAARNEHLQTKILPALQQGKWVLCDRFTDASYAYQGFGRGLSLERIALLETWIQGTLRPDATILFDLPVTLGMQRASARVGQSDRIEREQMAFFERIRTGYLQRAKTFPAQYHLVDATQTLPAVREQLAQNLALFLTKSGVMP